MKDTMRPGGRNPSASPSRKPLPPPGSSQFLAYNEAAGEFKSLPLPPLDNPASTPLPYFPQKENIGLRRGSARLRINTEAAAAASRALASKRVPHPARGSPFPEYADPGSAAFRSPGAAGAGTPPQPPPKEKEIPRTLRAERRVESPLPQRTGSNASGLGDKVRDFFTPADDKFFNTAWKKPNGTASGYNTPTGNGHGAGTPVGSRPGSRAGSITGKIKHFMNPNGEDFFNTAWRNGGGSRPGTPKREKEKKLVISAPQPVSQQAQTQGAGAAAQVSSPRPPMTPTPSPFKAAKNYFDAKLSQRKEAQWEKLRAQELEKAKKKEIYEHESYVRSRTFSLDGVAIFVEKPEVLASREQEEFERRLEREEERRREKEREEWERSVKEKQVRQEEEKRERKQRRRREQEQLMARLKAERETEDRLREASHVTQTGDFISYAYNPTAPLSPPMPEYHPDSVGHGDKESTGLTQWMRKGKEAVGKAADTIPGLRKRAPTANSDLEFADVGVQEMLEPCTVCGKVPQGLEWLSHGKCKDSCALSLRTTRRASLDRRASTGTIPQAAGRHRSVMKLANNHLRLVRQTIYEDPGNPFADEDEMSGSAETGWKDFDWSRDSTTESQNRAPTPRTAALKALEGMEKTERPRLTRSQSVFDNAEQDSSGDEYVPIRAQWRKGSIAEMQKEDTKRRQSETRDTKFYGFYNDIFEDEVWRKKV